jgi:hypothetical protein
MEPEKSSLAYETSPCSQKPVEDKAQPPKTE